MKIYKRISFGIIAFFIAFISIFTFFIPKSSVKKVSADEVNTTYNFVGSDLIYISALMINAGSTVGCWPIAFDVSFSVSSRSYVTFAPRVYTLTGDHDQNITNDGSGPALYYTLCNFVCLNTNGGQPQPVINANTKVCGGFFVPNTSSNYVPIIFGVKGLFNGNVLGVKLYTLNYMIASWDYFNNSALNVKFCYIEYFDGNSNAFFACIPVPNTFQFTDRTYYFDYALTTNDTYNLGYQQGYDDGIIDNQADSYQSGYNAGFDVGHARGVQDGIAQSTDYTFLGLFSAIFDAPINVLSSALDFNFLGVNLQGFFFSLITIAIIIFVVKLVT